MLNLRDHFRDERSQGGQALIEPNFGGGATDSFIAMPPGLFVLRGGGVGTEGARGAGGPEGEGGSHGRMS